MARRSGSYKSEKRRKELKRQKKKEEKRLKRQGKSLSDSDAVSQETDQPIESNETVENQATDQTEETTSQTEETTS